MDDVLETPGNPSPRRMLAELHAALPLIRQELKEVRDGMYGPDPNKPHEGMVSQVKELRDAKKKRDKLAWTALVGAAGAAGASLWLLITTGKAS